MAEARAVDGATRTMALLWSDTTAPVRGPKPGLTVERIVRAAIEIADAEGLAKLSMRRVAGAVGAGTMSLYTYVPDKATLIDLMQDTVLGDLPEGPPDESWREALTRFARGSYDLGLRHRWLAELPYSRGLMGPHQAALLESTLRGLARGGLPRDRWAAVFVLVSSYVTGAVRIMAETAELERSTGISTEQWWETRGPVLVRYVDPERFPLLNTDWYGAPDDADPFEFGLDRLLDGIAALFSPPAPPARSAG